MKTPLLVLMICFSLILCACETTRRGKVKWNHPPEPQLESLGNPFVPMDGGFTISSGNAKKLVDNVDELKAYIQKLEVQREAILKYYGN